MLKHDAQRWCIAAAKSNVENRLEGIVRGGDCYTAEEGAPKSLWKASVFPGRQCDTGTLSVPFCSCLCLLLASDSRQVTPSLWPPLSHLSAGMRTVISPYGNCKDELGGMQNTARSFLGTV